MSIAHQAVRGVLWNMSTGVGVRVLQLASTVVLMRFIMPWDYGQVQAAAVCALTAQSFSSFGFGQYLIARTAGPEEAWHATLLHVLLGALAQGLVLALAGPLSSAFDAPGMSRYMPGFALAMIIERLVLVPERLLQRDLRFKVVALSRGASELLFIAASLTSAPFLGPHAVVVGSLARSTALAGIYLVVSDRSEWLRPARLRGNTLRALFRFGLPTWIGSASSSASGRWGNLVVLALHGPTVAGRFAQTFALADTPTAGVADQVSDVLLPSFARYDRERRVPVLLRSTAIMALIVFPLAAGLGAVADGVVHALLDPMWWPMAPMLLILSWTGLARPMTWSMGAFTYAQGRPILVMTAGLLQLGLLLGSLLTVGRLGPLWACAATGIAFTLHMVIFALLLQRLEGVPALRLLASGARPLVASTLMVLVVFGVRALRLRTGLSAPLPGLFLEIAAGAVAYVLAVFAVARAQCLEVLALLAAARPGPGLDPPGGREQNHAGAAG